MGVSSCVKKSDDQENLTIKKVKANTAIVPPCEDARGADKQSTECDANLHQSRATNSVAGLAGAGGRVAQADRRSKSPT